MSRQSEWLKKGLDICAHDAALLEEKKSESFIELIKEYADFTEAERNNIIKMINASFDGNDRIYIYSYFMHYMKTEDFAKEALEAILQGEGMGFDFYTGSMLELQVTDRVTGYYMQKRKLHKRNMESFLEILNPSFQYIPVEKRNRNRIAVMTEQILNIGHAPTRLVLNMLYVLQKHLGYEVMLFVCPSDGFLSGGLWHQYIHITSLDVYREHKLILQYKDIEFQGYQVNMKPVNLKEYHMMFDLIYAWNPLFVFGIGIINPVADICSMFTTLVMRAVSIYCPVSEAQILLRVVKQSEELETEYKQFIHENQVQLFVEGKPPVVIEKSENEYRRSEYGLPEDKFLIALVGTRLDEEINTEFVHVMKNIITKNPNTAFVFIGEVKRIKKFFAEDVFEKHIYYMGLQDDLVGKYGMLDLFMNPKRMGGGYSSVMALTAGIPAVSLPDCDVAGHIGEGLTVKDYQEMEETVCRYINDPSFYEEKKQYVQERMKENTDEKMVQYVQNMMNQIIEHLEKQG